MSDCNGVVYTKDWVVSLVLDMAEYTEKQSVWKKTIVEPCCGQGAFLKQIVKRLLKSAQNDNALDKRLIINSLRSFDIDRHAVERSRNIIYEELKIFGFNDNEADEIANEWVICDDYLLRETIPADYVVGNPPYLKATEIPKSLKQQYIRKLSSMTKGTDIYVGFFQRGLESLRDRDGVLCFICADRWLQNQYGKKIRELIAKHYHIDSIIRMHDVDAFESTVSAYPAITRLDHGQGAIKYANCNSSFAKEDASSLKAWLSNSRNASLSNAHFCTALLNQPTSSDMIPLSSSKAVDRITKLVENFPTLEEAGVKIGIGIATGKDKVFITKSNNIVEKDRMLPLFNMKDWRRNHNTDNNWLINPWDKEGKLVNLRDYPLLEKYFEANRIEISNRHIAKKKPAEWYRTIDKVNWNIYMKPLLLLPDISSKAVPVYSDGTRYPCHKCYWLSSDIWNMKVLGGLLISDIVDSFIDAIGVKMRGGAKRFQAQYLRLIRVPFPEKIHPEIANKLITAFDNNDLELANEAALSAYGLEKY